MSLEQFPITGPRPQGLLFVVAMGILGGAFSVWCAARLDVVATLPKRDKDSRQVSITILQ